MQKTRSLSYCIGLVMVVLFVYGLIRYPDLPIRECPSGYCGSQRQPILKAGTISFDGSGIDCLVRNMSDEGANLEVESQIGIPNSFDLVIDSEHSNHQCHVVWRKARRIGVAFD